MTTQILRPLIPLCAVLSATIAISSCKGGREADTSLPKVVALSPDGVRHEKQAFSPDGKHVAYWSPYPDRPGMQLWVANADLTSPMQLPVFAYSTVFQPPQWSSDSASLAVGASQYGVSQVVIVPAAGGDVRRVTEGAGVTFPMVWSRDGTLLNYYGTAPGGRYQSFVYTLASGASRELAPAEKRSHLGAASPDGSHVAYFVIGGGEKTTIWVADGNGDHPRQLTTDGFETLEQYHEWSPDGKELLFQSRRTGHADLWIVPIDGGPARQLTRDVRDDYGGVWSSDGKWIAFLSNRGRQTDVWVVPAAGGTESRVTDTPEEELGPMQWRGGSSTLTFGVRTVSSGVWARDLADGKERRVIPDAPQVSFFTASPDGKQILYVIEHGGGIQDLAVAPTAGADARVLIAGGGTVLNPRWSPDGQKIAFQSDRGGSQDIWIVDVPNGGAPRQLTSWPGDEAFPVWNNDGATVYFRSDNDTKLGDVWRVPASGGEPTRVTTAGTFGLLMAGNPGAGGFFAHNIATAGQVALSRYRADGSSNVLWDKSSAYFVAASGNGDQVLAAVQQPDGKLRDVLFAADGTSAKPFPPGCVAQALSRDGQWAICGLQVAGAYDVSLLHVADGTMRSLTTTPESEEGAEFTPDGKTILFRRTQTVQRIMTVDVSKLVGKR